MADNNSEKSGADIELQVHICNALHNREWVQIEDINKRIWKMAHSLYEI